MNIPAHVLLLLAERSGRFTTSCVIVVYQVPEGTSVARNLISLKTMNIILSL